MSVALYSHDEIRGLFRAMTETRVSSGLAETLLRLAARANRRAYMYQYAEVVPAEPLTLDGPVYVPMSDWTVGTWLRNLLYNTIANDGTPFLSNNATTVMFTLADEHLKRVAIPAELLPVPDPKPSKQESRYVAAALDRNDVCKAIKAELRRRSGKDWSVTGGRGTAYGWIAITAPKSRLQEFGYMTDADRTELAKLLSLDSVHQQGVSIAASREYRQEYLDRAQGIEPSTVGVPYWD